MISVPKVDRGPLDAHNIVGKVVDFRNDLYQISTTVGTLNNWYLRNEIQPTEIKINEPLQNFNFWWTGC